MFTQTKMWYELEPQQRGVKVVVDGKHIKTLPTKLGKFFTACANKIEFDKKRLTPKERLTLDTYLKYQNWIDKLAVSEKHLHKLIKDAYPVATKHVVTKDGERYELVLDNKMKIKCPESIYHLFTEKPNKITHSNF